MTTCAICEFRFDTNMWWSDVGKVAPRQWTLDQPE